MIKKAACYCRVSTKKDEQLESLWRQKEFFNSYFSSNRQYELYDIYVDEGISGKSLKNRKAFDRMLADAGKKCFDVILVKDISRFARNTVDLLNSIRMLKEYNVKVLFITNNMDTFDNSEFIVTLFGALAQEESENISKRIKFSKNITAGKGRVPSFVFGYDRADNYTVIPNEYEAGWVRRIYEMYVFEGMGTARIAEHLNFSKVLTKKKIENGWSQRVISSILRNELYIGKVINRKSEIVDFKTGKRRELDRDDWIVIERPEFRIIDDELFHRAQKLLTERKECFVSDKKRPSSKHSLSNLIVCANDGYSYRRCCRKYSSTGKLHKWWECSYRNVKGVSSCDNSIKVDEEQMHYAVMEFLMSVCNSREEMVKKIKSRLDKELQKRCTLSCSRKELTNEIRGLKAKRDRLVDLYSEGEIDKRYLNDKLRNVTGRIEEIEASLNLKNLYEGTSADIDDLINSFFDKIVDKADSLLNNVFLKTIFEKFVVYEDGRINAELKADSKGGFTMGFTFGEIVDPDTGHTVPVFNNGT